jgi:hypothetical protein
VFSDADPDPHLFGSIGSESGRIRIRIDSTCHEIRPITLTLMLIPQNIAKLFLHCTVPVLVCVKLETVT